MEALFERLEETLDNDPRFGFEVEYNVSNT